MEIDTAPRFINPHDSSGFQVMPQAHVRFPGHRGQEQSISVNAGTGHSVTIDTRSGCMGIVAGLPFFVGMRETLTKGDALKRMSRHSRAAISPPAQPRKQCNA
jgi:hypothetical protein